MDAGYDVRNYKKVAERYGTNDDLVRLFDEAHKKGIKILLDLVPGHTSDQHEWFLEAKKPQRANIQTVTSLQRAYGTHRRSTV